MYVCVHACVCVVCACVCFSLCICIGLLDPRWRDQQNKQVDDKKQQDEIFAVGMFDFVLVKKYCLFVVVVV